MNFLALSVFSPSSVIANAVPASLSEAVCGSASVFAEVLDSTEMNLEAKVMPDSELAGAEGKTSGAQPWSPSTIRLIPEEWMPSGEPQGSSDEPEDAQAAAIAYGLTTAIPTPAPSTPPPPPIQFDLGKTRSIAAEPEPAASTTVVELEPIEPRTDGHVSEEDETLKASLVPTVETPAARVAATIFKHVTSPALDQDKTVSAEPVPEPPPVADESPEPPLPEPPSMTSATETATSPEKTAAKQPPIVLEARITPKSLDERERPSADPEAITSSEPQADKVESPSSIKVSVKPDFEERPDTQRDADSAFQRQDQNGKPIVHDVHSSTTSERPAQSPRLSPPEVRPEYTPRETTMADTPAATPLKNIELRIPDANGGVSVRLQDRGGELHVSVRSNDTVVAQSISEGLPDLTRNLDRHGLSIQTWTPRADADLPTRVAGEALRNSLQHEPSHATSEQTQSTMGPASTTSSQAKNEQHHQQRRPDWLEEMNRRAKRPAEENNFKEYLS